MQHFWGDVSMHNCGWIGAGMEMWLLKTVVRNESRMFSLAYSK